LPPAGGSALPGRRIVIDSPAIDIQGISKRFTLPRKIGQILRHPFDRKRIQVLKDVSLTVPTGSITGLLGPNGAGKTTLLRILAATVSPDEGKVQILGQDAVRHTGRVRQHIGFVLGDERSFFWRLTGMQNLRFFATLSNLTKSAGESRIAELSRLLSLDDELPKPFRDLSTGMRQRMGLARALLHDPKVLLIDEPTRALDPGAAQRARKLIRQTLVGELGKTILLATHNVEEAREIANRVAFLKEGEIQTEGPTEKALERVPDVFDLEEE
jgi:ABC-2 type transport system ATP-binding protein